MKNSERLTTNRRYNDFRWFVPNRYLRLLVATGRFQKLHYGHVVYLRSALIKAIDEGSRFRIISGPSDCEYRAQPGLSGTAVRFTPFRERQFLLSLLLGIPKRCVVEGFGRPSSVLTSADDLRLKSEKVREHHDQTNHWVENFFHPIGLGMEDGLATEVTLFVTAKEEDKIYHESYPDESIHPIELVRNYWGRTKRVNICKPKPVTDASGSVIRSSHLDFDNYSICETVPAAAYAAEQLVKIGVLGLRFRKTVGRIHKKFGFKSYVPGQLDLF